MNRKKLTTLLSTIALSSVLAACTGAANTTTGSNTTSTASSQATTTQTAEYFSQRDLDASYDASKATKINLNGSSATVEGSGVSVSGSTVTISQEGTYILSGTGENVQVVVNATNVAKIQVVLDNVTLTNSDAAFVVEQADKVFLTLAEGSTNTITDGATRKDSSLDAAIYSKDDLTINGTGTLTVTGNYGNAIESNDDLIVTGGTINLKAAAHGVSVNDAFNVTKAVISVDAGDDGIHADNDTDTTLGNIYLENATIQVTAGDDGVHATSNLIINGGTVAVKQSTEGLEGKKVHIMAGDVNVKASDDGVNATDGTSTEGPGRPGTVTNTAVEILIDGGMLTVDAGGDGLDANGNITINNGTVVVNGPTNSGNAALDYDGNGIVNGGTVTIVGSNGMAQGFTTGSTQASIMTNVSGNAGSSIVISDSSGKEVSRYQATKSFGNVVFSSSELKEGETYTVTVDGQSVQVTAALVTSNQGGMGPGGNAAPPQRSGSRG